jgi:hypothetical protein
VTLEITLGKLFLLFDELAVGFGGAAAIAIARIVCVCGATVGSGFN